MDASYLHEGGVRCVRGPHKIQVISRIEAPTAVTSMLPMFTRLGPRLSRAYTYQSSGHGCCRHRSLLILLTILAIAGCEDSNESGSYVSSHLIDAANEYGLAADGITDDEPGIQSALDHAAHLGGGIVYLREGSYGIARPLIVRSGVRLVGEGRERTVLRTLTASLAKNVDGAGVWAAIAMVSANNASVSDLTVDLSVAKTNANGVALLPSGAAFEGPPSSNCLISGLSVIGGGNYHSYLIWNLRGRDISIVNNVVDGGILVPTDSLQEGIESYGGTNVLVGWNTVRNVGSAALNFGSAGLQESDVSHLSVVGNVVTNSGRGLNIGPALSAAGPQNIADVEIVENKFIGLWRTGIFVPVQAGTEVRDLRIADNTIAYVGNEASNGATGIHFEGAPANSLVSASLASGAYVIGNRISHVRGVNSFGVLVNYLPGMTIVGNTISEIDHGGVQSFGSASLLLKENLIENVGYIGIGSYGPESTIFLRSNTILNWGLGAPVAGALIDDAVAGEVRENTFGRESLVGAAVIVGPAASSVVVFGNRLTGADGQTTLHGVAVPYVNLGARSNLGTFVVAAHEAAVTINHELVSPTSRVRIEQVSGDPLEFSTVVGLASFRVTFGTMPRGQEQFRYEIDP